MTDPSPQKSPSAAAWIEHPGLHVAAILVTVSLLYLPTLSYPFVFDDYGYLVNNPLIKDFQGFIQLKDIPGFIRSQAQQLPHPDLAINFVLRPVCYLTFYLNYVLGGLSVEGYRLVNIVIHGMNGALLYRFLQRLLTTAPLPVERRAALRIALFAALLFAVNPLQTESVTYIIQRFTSLATTLYLACLICYLESLVAEEKKQRQLAYLGSVTLLLTGMLVKEFVFTAPVMLLALELVIRRRRLAEAVRHTLPHLCCMPLIPLLMALIVRGQGSDKSGVTGMINVVNFDSIPPWHYFLSEMRALFSYARLLLLPYNQNIDPHYPLYTSPLHPEVLAAFLLIALLLWTAWRLYRCERDTLANACAFFIIWYFVAFSVDSSVVPLPDLFAEHRSYLPSVGLFCGLTLHLERTLASRAPITARLETRMVAACALACCLYAGLTVARNTTWSSLVGIWSNAAGTAPGNARTWHNLGISYMVEQNNHAMAEQSFRRAIATVPPYRQAFFSLAKLLKIQQRLPEALDVYREALKQYKDDAELMAEIGVLYYELGQFDAAVHVLKKVAASGDPPEKARTYLNLARQRLTGQRQGAADDAR